MRPERIRLSCGLDHNALDLAALPLVVLLLPPTAAGSEAKLGKKSAASVGSGSIVPPARITGLKRIVRNHQLVFSEELVRNIKARMNLSIK